MTSIQPSPYQSDKVMEFDGRLVGLAKPEFKGLTGQGKRLQTGNTDKEDYNIFWHFILINNKVLFYKPPQHRWFAPRAIDIYERDGKLYYVGKENKVKLIDLNDPTIELRGGEMKVNDHIYSY